ncbi:MAG TPA: beta-ketoacyl-ACP synthase II [candidate division Zixibacteria bacterium]|nr:beta-ketoacyl-ACP synthase II [candidate division Zixibacteria bacterium]
MKNNGYDNRRVVVTGLGVVSAIGTGKDAYCQSLQEGRSGIKRISAFDVSSYSCQIAAEISGFDPLTFMAAQQARRIDRFAQLGVAAATLALQDAGIRPGTNGTRAMGVILGTSVGTLCYAEQQIALFYEKGVKRINPFFATSVIPSSAATQILLSLGIKGPSHTITTACASGTCSVGEAFEMIRHGALDVVLAGGAEAPITPLVLATLGSIHLLTSENETPATAYRPFARNAAGFALGEGSGILVLEEAGHALKRNAKIYGEVVGFGSSCDAYDVMAFDPTFEGPVAAIRHAMTSSGVRPDEIGYVNLHGIALPEHDRGEVSILKLALGESACRIPVSVTKPLTGHTLGASGAMELVACCLMMEKGFLHPTINLEEPDPQCDLDFVPNQARAARVDTMMSVSFGFGGYNAACIIRAFAQ